MKDPIVEEVRRIRDEHSRSFDYNLEAIFNAYQQQQLLLGSRLVRLPPKGLDHRSGRPRTVRTADPTVTP